MNCKEGDLCVIVRVPHRAYSGALGRFVVAERLTIKDGTPVWVLSEPFKFSHPWFGVCTVTGVDDADMRPIRGQEGQDETLSWCDVPDEVTANV